MGSRRRRDKSTAPPTAIAASRPQRRQHTLWGAAVFIVALAVRGAYLWEMRGTEIFSVLIADAASYHAWAMRIAGGDWLGAEVFYQAPLYPYVLGAIYSVAGPDPFAARVVQIVLGASACWLLFDAGRSFVSAAAGLAAGLLLAIYPPAVFFDGLIQKSALDLTFTTALLALLGRQLDRPAAWRWGGVGGVLGALVLTRENALAAAPVLVAWQWAYFRPPPTVGARWTTALLLGLALVLGPVGLRNAAVGGEFHLTTAQSGPNFYIGNHAAATGRYVSLRPGHGDPALERAEATELAEAAVGRVLTPRQVSRYWIDQALAWITAHPGAWLELMARKWSLVWNAAEVTDSEDLDTYGDYSWLLRSASVALHFGVLCPLAAVGILLTWPQRRRLVVLYALLVVLAVSVAAFFVVARYRHPLVPILAIFAGAGVAAVCAAARRRQWRRLTGAAIVGLAAAVASNWPLITPGSQRAPTYYNLGVALAGRGDLDAARRLFETAVQLDPRLGVAWGNLGIVHGLQGDFDAAEHNFREALRREPGLAEPHANLALVLVQRGQSDEALLHYLEAARLTPRAADARTNAGFALLGAQRYAEAAEHFTAAVAIAPRAARARYGMGLARAGQGQTAGAIDALRSADALATAAPDEGLRAEIAHALLSLQAPAP